MYLTQDSTGLTSTEQTNFANGIKYWPTSSDYYNLTFNQAGDQDVLVTIDSTLQGTSTICTSTPKPGNLPGNIRCNPDYFGQDQYSGNFSTFEGAHEFGHQLGFDDEGNSGSVMLGSIYPPTPPAVPTEIADCDKDVYNSLYNFEVENTSVDEGVQHLTDDNTWMCKYDTTTVDTYDWDPNIPPHGDWSLVSSWSYDSPPYDCFLYYQ